MVNYTKRKINKRVADYDFPPFGDLLITDLIEYLEQSMEQGATHLELDIDSYDGSIDSINIHTFKSIEETDEEYATRIAQDEALQARRLQMVHDADLQTYERLKLKFANIEAAKQLENQ